MRACQQTLKFLSIWHFKYLLATSPRWCQLLIQSRTFMLPQSISLSELVHFQISSTLMVFLQMVIEIFRSFSPISAKNEILWYEKQREGNVKYILNVWENIYEMNRCHLKKSKNRYVKSYKLKKKKQKN